jgi:diguanylate cyclase (GGDEF)-like protein/PAS domain S-box-containing protein
MALVGLDGRWLRANEHLCRILGYTCEELLAVDFQAITHPEDMVEDVKHVQRLLNAEVESYDFEKRCLHKAGHAVWVLLTATLVRSPQGQPQFFVAQLQDIGERKRQQEESQRTKELLEATLANIQDGVALLDANRRVLVANRAYADLFALDPQQLIGQSRDEFVTHVSRLADDPTKVRAVLSERPPAHTITSNEFLLRYPQRRHLRRTVKPVGMASQQLQLVVWRDVTAEKELIAERERELFTDALTGIASRRAAENTLMRELARLRRNGVGFSLAMFDIDRFKQVNDRYGHPVGDEVLRRVANVLAAAARATDLVARWGGEEFIAIIASDLEGARAFCDRARQAVAEQRWPEVDQVTMSAGVTDCGLDESAEDIVARADRLLYAAKGAGRNRVMAASTDREPASSFPRRSVTPVTPVLR